MVFTKITLITVLQTEYCLPILEVGREKYKQKQRSKQKKNIYREETDTGKEREKTDV